MLQSEITSWFLLIFIIFLFISSFFIPYHFARYYCEDKNSSFAFLFIISFISFLFILDMYPAYSKGEAGVFISLLLFFVCFYSYFMKGYLKNYLNPDISKAKYLAPLSIMHAIIALAIIAL